MRQYGFLSRLLFYYIYRVICNDIKIYFIILYNTRTVIYFVCVAKPHHILLT